MFSVSLTLKERGIHSHLEVLTWLVSMNEYNDADLCENLLFFHNTSAVLGCHRSGELKLSLSSYGWFTNKNDTGLLSLILDRLDYVKEDCWALTKVCALLSAILV